MPSFCFYKMFNNCCSIVFLKLLCALMSVSILAFPIVAQRVSNRPSPVRSQLRYNALSIDCQNVTEIVFVGFFPCLRGSSFEAPKNISECDLLAEAAAHLAVERVNQDPTVLPNITLSLHPIYSSTDKDIDLYEILVTYLDILNKPNSNQIWGVIGPSDNLEAAATILPFIANSGVIAASYSIRDTRFDDDIPTFYRTLPSTSSTNFGRLVLLHNHRWFRIATLGYSDEECYVEEREDFLVLFHRFVEEGLFDIDLGLTETIIHSPEASLNNIKSRDINIIMGFFGPENARNILCLTNSIGLVSRDHAWVLPSYYNPNWWRISDKNGSSYTDSCSDEEMKSILESVIFVDGIKVPPVDLSLGGFHTKLVTKALDLFPSLTEEDLKPYLLRSRATNTYDAVTLLAQSVGVAFDQGGDSCTNTNLVQVALEEVFMECEYCRIYSECFLSNNQSLQCQQLCGSDYKPEISPNDFKIIPLQLRSDRILNRFGQVLYSQFLDGEECPINLWWPITRRGFMNNYLSIEQLDKATNCIAQRLNLTRENFVGRESNCSPNFIWRGSSIPPSSNFLEVSYVPIGWLVSIGLLVLVGEVVALVLLILNIAMRKNKNVKASSPWLNIILILGVIIRLPSPLYLGLVLSANGYEGLRGKDLTPVCYCFVWGYYIGAAMYISTLLVKNWRIYRIFQNKHLQFRGSCLSDGVLVAEQVIIIIPILIPLIVLSATGFRFTGVEVQSKTLQIINITICASTNNSIYHGVMSGYLFIPFAILFIVVLLTANVPLSAFRREHLATYFAIVLSVIPVTFITLIQTFLLTREPMLPRSYAIVGLEAFWTFLLIILLTIVLVPSIYSGIREKLKEKKSRYEERERMKLSEHCDDLKQEAETLRTQLEQINMDIKKLKTDLTNTIRDGDKEEEKYAETSQELEQSSNKVGSIIENTNREQVGLLVLETAAVHSKELESES